MVRPGGTVVLADHLLDETRPPPPGRRSSSACATPRTGLAPAERLRALGAAAGWSSSARRSSRCARSHRVAERGSGHAVARPLLERLLAAPPASAERFAIRDGALVMTSWAARFSRPAAPCRG